MPYPLAASWTNTWVTAPMSFPFCIIVQGMSGSPIIQNGKLIGAVTHVFVKDSAKGYGIFIEDMMKNVDL